MGVKFSIEELRENVEAIGKAVKYLRARVSDRALTVLIQHAAPTVGDARPKKPTIGMIRAVLDGMDNLEHFVFGDEEDDGA